MAAVYGCPVDARAYWRRLVPCLLGGVCLLPSAVQGATGGPDTFGYTWRDNLSGGVQPDYETGEDAERIALDDDGSTTVLFEPGFTFPFYGQVFSSITIHNNGGVTFTGSGNLSYDHPCPWETPTRLLIAPYWMDLAAPSAGVSGIYAWSGGPPADRYFVVEWFEMPVYEHVGTVRLEIKLFASSGRIEFHYEDVIVDGPLVDLGQSAAVGIGSAASLLAVSCNSSALANDYAVTFSPPVCKDEDGDGSCAGTDCDDANGSIFPGAGEVCDGEDTDCNGSLPIGEIDVDRDGFGTCQDDCDDTDADLSPADADTDSFSTCAGDCDDTNDALTPEDADGDGLSSCLGDCEDDNPLVTSADGDGDGHSSCDGDCDDDDPGVQPGATERCDGVDEDCDGAADDGLDCEDVGPEVPAGHDIPYGCILDTQGAAFLPLLLLLSRRRRALA